MLSEIRRKFVPPEQEDDDEIPLDVNISFVHYLDRWLKIAKTTIKPATYTSYSQMIRSPIRPYFEEKGLTELSSIVGFKVLNRVINKEAMKLVNVDLWKIDRTSFYADIHVELMLQSEHGSRTWNGLLNCLCSFEENKKFICDILSLTDKTWQNDNKDCVRLNPFLVPYYTNSQMDQIAEQIWKEYGMEEALTDPTKRNAIKLAKRMADPTRSLLI